MHPVRTYHAEPRFWCPKYEGTCSENSKGHLSTDPRSLQQRSEKTNFIAAHQRPKQKTIHQEDPRNAIPESTSQRTVFQYIATALIATSERRHLDTGTQKLRVSEEGGNRNSEKSRGKEFQEEWQAVSKDWTDLQEYSTSSKKEGLEPSEYKQPQVSWNRRCQGQLLWAQAYTWEIHEVERWEEADEGHQVN